MFSSSTCEVIGANSYPLSCRYWKADEAFALVVLVHGVVSHSLWLEKIATSLADNHISCIGMDRRGAGLNTQSPGDAPDSEALLLDLLAVMAFARQQQLPVHLCGFCWGANYVVNFLNKYPEEAVSTILLAPSLFPSERITRQPFTMGESGTASELPTMPLECFTDGPMYESFIKPDPLRTTRVSPRMNRVMSEFSRGIWMKFLRLQSPTLVMLAADDEVVDNRATEQLFGRLGVEPKQLKTVPAKHGIQFDAPEQVVNTLHQWMLSLQSSAQKSHET